MSVFSDRKTFVSLLVLLSLCLVLYIPGVLSGETHLIHVTSASADIIYVDDNNTDGPWDGSNLYPFQSIQTGIDAADPGDIVFVYAGVYIESVTINKPLTLKGENTDSTIITGFEDKRILVIKADDVTVQNFTIKDTGQWTQGIEILLANNVSICNTHLKNTGGIMFLQSSFSTMSNNIIEDNNLGVALFLSDNLLIKDNVITDNAYGIYLFFVSDYNTISNNEIQSNMEGVYVCGCSNNTITQNQLADNTLGVRCIGESYCNLVYLNNFVNNTDHAYDVSNNWWYKETPDRGNYWDGYQGVDSDGDGLGDDPYQISGGTNQDIYPLMHPWAPINCGDVNDDGILNVSDVVFLINYAYIPDAPAPEPECSGDVNGDGILNVSDAVYLINYVFIPGSPPPIPDCCP